MSSNLSRKKLPVRRLLAERYLLIALIGYAASVLGVRLFLELTNYPRVEFGSLHIAHVIWGGLFLFVAALLPLMFANRWALFWSALLSGIGFGLFIDEIGKFITQSNDYFYPPAAPLIYAFFLLTVLVFLQFRKPRQNTTREDLYHIFSMLEEYLDEDLDEEERNFLIQRLTHITQNAQQTTLARLAASLLEFVQSNCLVIPDTPNSFEKAWKQFIRNIDRFFTQQRLWSLLVLGLIWHGVISILGLFNLTLLSIQSTNGQAEKLLQVIQTIPPNIPLFWLMIKVSTQAAIGILSLASAFLMLIRHERNAIRIAIIVLTTSLTIVNILVFYLDQFSASINALFEFVLLLALVNYRRRFMTSEVMELLASQVNDSKNGGEQTIPVQ